MFQGGEAEIELELSEESFSLYFDDEEGEPEQEVNVVDIEKLRKVKLKKKLKQACSICLNDLKKGDQAVKLDCSHSFHSKCIIPWFSNQDKCPNCRKTVTTC